MIINSVLIYERGGNIMLDKMSIIILRISFNKFLHCLLLKHSLYYI